MVDAAAFWTHIGASKALIDAAVAAGLQAADHTFLLQVFDEAFSRYAPDLTFEFGLNRDGHFELIISAGGIRDLVPNVQKLLAAAPRYDLWRVIAFRPRQDLNLKLQLGGQTCDIASTRVRWREQGERWDVVVYPDVPAGVDKDILGQIAFLALDIAIGEYDVMTRIGGVERQSLPKDADRHRVPTIQKFVERFDAYFMPGKRN